MSQSVEHWLGAKVPVPEIPNPGQDVKLVIDLRVYRGRDDVDLRKCVRDGVNLSLIHI